MKQTQQKIDTDLTLANRLYGPINVAEFDDLYYRFERTVEDGTLTGVLEFGESLGMDDEPHNWSNVNMTDSSKHYLDVSGFAFLWVRVKTAQSGYRGNLHLYIRESSAVGGGGA